MVIFHTAEKLHHYLLGLKNADKHISFVPTMGALHAGHLALIEQCIAKNEFTVSSIFVNPTQFNNKSDFDKYPISIENDIYQLEKAGCDILFLPSQEQIYPPGFQFRQFSLGYLENILEGEFRPGHFQGVCQVVDRLLEIVCADTIVLGEKDYQQCRVIIKLIELMKLTVKVRIHPIIRDQDGLALSSRNSRLTPEERHFAPLLFKSLVTIKNKINQVDSGILLFEEKNKLTENKFKVDYLEIADAETLLPVTEQTNKKIILIAAFINEVRLIDNILI